MQGIEASENRDEAEYESISKGFDVCMILQHRIHDLPEVYPSYNFIYNIVYNFLLLLGEGESSKLI